MILLQSYSSPSAMSADSGVYNVIKQRFLNLRVLFEKNENIGEVRITKILKLALQANLFSKTGEVIFGWGGDLAVYAWAIGKMFFIKRLYYSQNLIFRESSNLGIKGKIRYWLYRKALRSKNFAVTVNSEPLIEYYSELFACSKSKFTVVYDNMSLNDDEKNMLKHVSPEPYVFCGGKAGRDVLTFMEIVKYLPNVHFKCVFKEGMILPEMKNLKNLKIYTDIPKKEFYEILNNAAVCCIPLKSKVPCGLYVMQHAVLLNIPIVSTDTYSMRTIVPNDKYGFLLPMGDAHRMAEKIELLLNNKSLCRVIAQNAIKNFDKFKPENVGKQLCDALYKYQESFSKT